MNKKLEKILDPKKYREKKAKDFLAKVNNLNFKKFEGKNMEDVIEYICGGEELRKLQRTSATYCLLS